MPSRQSNNIKPQIANKNLSILDIKTKQDSHELSIKHKEYCIRKLVINQSSKITNFSFVKTEILDT